MDQISLDQMRLDEMANVDHPSHYNKGSIEVIDAIEGLGLSDDFCLGNAIKYIARARHKGNEVQDLLKARWYLERKIQQLTGKVSTTIDDLSDKQDLAIQGYCVKTTGYQASSYCYSLKPPPEGEGESCILPPAVAACFARQEKDEKGHPLYRVYTDGLGVIFCKVYQPDGFLASMKD